MPLTTKLQKCGKLECENETFYYKIVWIPYQEGIRASSHRGGRGKEGQLFLCPEHYPMAEEDVEYAIGNVTLKLGGTDDF